MRKYLNLKKNSKGNVFLMTMVITFLIVMYGGFAYQMSTQDLHLVNLMKYSQQAQDLADAGLYRALSLIKSNWAAKDTAANFPLTTLGPGTYDASVALISGRYLVSSLGSVKGVSRTVTAEVQGPALSALDFALAGGGNVEWDPGTGGSSGTLTGNIYSGGNLSMDGTIIGDVYYSGTVSGSNTGTQTVNTSTVSFPTVTSSYYQTIAQANGQYFSTTTKTYNNTTPLPANPPGGVIFVNGNVVITHTQATTACIFATGNITMQKSGSATLKFTLNQYSNYPALVALGNISITSTGNSSGGAYFTSTGLIYAGGNFDLGGNHYDNPKVNITGSIIARGNLTTSLTAWNTLTMTYAKQSPPGFSVGSASTKIVSYNS